MSLNCILNNDSNANFIFCIFNTHKNKLFQKKKQSELKKEKARVNIPNWKVKSNLRVLQ